MDEIRERYDELCLKLNMDNETRDDGWKNYTNLRQHYLLEGDPLQWLSISLYMCCSRNECGLNPISIHRLLKCSKEFSLKMFFDKIHQWEDMANLPDQIRKKIDQLENSFHISSIIYQKYPKMFSFIFGGNEQKYLSFDYHQQRILSQLNRKFHQKSREKKFFDEEFFYSLGWTIFALAKTLYPSTFYDLSASFHLLIASIQYLDHLQSFQGFSHFSLLDQSIDMKSFI